MVEARAAESFDPATAASPATGTGVSFEPEPASIFVRAQPSAYVDDETAARHESSGVIIWNISGAAQSVWYSHFHQFVAALPEMFRWPIGQRETLVSPGGLSGGNFLRRAVAVSEVSLQSRTLSGSPSASESRSSSSSSED